MKDIRSNDKPLTFAILADSRDYPNTSINKPVFTHLLKLIKKRHDIKYLFFLGDMAYWTGDKDKTIAELEVWQEIVEDIFDEEPKGFLWPAIGNHEVINENIFWPNPEQNEAAFNTVFNYLPEQLEGFGKTVYYFDHNNVRFIILNSVRKVCDPNTQTCTKANHIGETQRKWLEQVLIDSQKKKITHNFVMFHHPVYGREYDLADAKEVWEIFDTYNVNAVYVGHDHIYNRRIINDALYPVDNRTHHVFFNQVQQIVTGGAGAPLDLPTAFLSNSIVAPIGVYHYIIVNIYDNWVKTRTYDINNTMVDFFSYNKKDVKNLR